MSPSQLFAPFAAAAAALVLASCASKSPQPPPVGPDGARINPHPPGTYAHFTAEPNYPKTLHFWKNEEVLARTGPENSRIIINLARQRGYLMNGDEVAIDYPICSGRKSHPTPTGTFPITEKIIDKASNKYGRIYDAEGKMIHSDADITKDEVPEGGRFQGAPMLYWMRLTNDGVGHHIGPLPRSRNPVSHACIRGPSAVMPTVFSKVKVGTPIIIQ
jgi:lipoprotein-anchoring transpeptidase ErfK/SrfK